MNFFKVDVREFFPTAIRFNEFDRYTKRNMFGKETKRENDLILKFLETNVMGKTLYTDMVSYELEEGKLIGDYSDEISFHGLSASAFGFTFEMTVLARETIYSAEDNKRKSRVKSLSGISTFRYHLAKRRSTDELTGFMHCIATNLPGQTAEAIVYGIHKFSLNNDLLSWWEKEVIYRDMATADGGFRPISLHASARFLLESGNTKFEYEVTGTSLDPETLESNGKPEEFPGFIAREK